MIRQLKKLASAQALSRPQAVGAFVGGVAISVILAMLGWCAIPPLASVDNALLDAFIRAFASNAPHRDTVVVDVDDASLSAVGQWPWPRYRVAKLIDQIAAQGPAAIALDIVLPEPDRASLSNIQQTYKRDFGVELTVSGVPDGMLDNDGFLGNEMARTGAIGADYFYFDQSSHDHSLPRPGVGFDGRVDLLRLSVAPGVMMATDAIASRTRLSGFVNSRPDADGALRRLPMLLSYGGVIHPSLSLAAAMRRLGLSSGTIEADRNGLAVRLGRHRVPIDPSGYTMLRFDGKPAAYPSISAVDVLNGAAGANVFRGKIVFIGTSVVGLNDVHRTAVDARFPGLQIQSVMAEDILQDRLVTTPAWQRAAAAGACLLVGALIAGSFIAGSGLGGFAVTSLLTAAGLLVMSALLFAKAQLFVPVGAPVVVSAALLTWFLGVRVALEQRRAGVWRRRLDNARQVTIESMAAVAETRDPETGAHIKRTQHYVRAIAEALKAAGAYPEILTNEFIDLLFASAPLHDIGKVGVPDHILLKPGKLTAAEMDIMQQHADFGSRIILNTSEQIEGENFLAIACEIAATHHEKWDGSGYPRGLAGPRIPLSGRIMAVADIYDALISRRCYKEPFTHAHAMTLIRGMRGTTFDPQVLDAFLRVEAVIVQIAGRFKDEQGLVTAPVSVASELVESPVVT